MKILEMCILVSPFMIIKVKMRFNKLASNAYANISNTREVWYVRVQLIISCSLGINPLYNQIYVSFIKGKNDKR